MTAAFRHTVTVLERDAPVTLKWRADLSVGGQHESNPHLSTPAGLCVTLAIDQPCEGSGIKVAGRPLAALQSVAADAATRMKSLNGHVQPDPDG